MRTARLVGLSPDGKSLIVATDDGEELQMAADDRLRAAIRGDRPRLGQLEIQMNTSLSPRDIQTRIRGGESLEDVTRLAGIPLDRVERFAAPVLAEREHVAAMAMSASVRRRGETSGHRSLRITVTERLVTRGVDSDTVSWDSYRLDDGRWAVTADYTSGAENRHACFTYDPRGRFSVAANDEARRLLGEQPTGPQPVRQRPADSSPVAEDTEPTVDLSDELALVRATREPPAVSARRDEADEPTVHVPRLRPVADLPLDFGGDGYSEDSVRVYSGLSDAAAVPETGPAAGWEPAILVDYPVEPSQQVDGEPPTEDDPLVSPELPAEVPGTEEQPPEIDAPTLPGTDPEERPTQLDQERRAGRRKRATVPSWDEIMFGGPKRSR
ncbi:MAG TPA: septation protein SepH [Propionibacteriaceae bacterium]|nr:septation protein SepH [Propionibacteriaceae bacterium]